MAISTRYAPCVNFVIVTITRTSPVSPAPSALTPRLLLAARRSAGDSASPASWRFQCRTIPAWPKVKDVNTPMM